MTLLPLHGVVLNRAHGSEMCGIHTLGDAAEMVKMHSIWNGASLTFVDPAVSHPVRASDVNPRITPWPTISLSGETAEPVMTRSSVSGVAQFPVVELLGSSELPMHMSGGKQGGLPATAEAECCLLHLDNTTTMSPKEAM